MSNIRQTARVFFALLFFLFSQMATGLAAEAEKPIPPWTQEKVKPPEIQDKEKKNEDPLATCEKKEKRTGEKYHQVAYKDGTVVRYYPGDKNKGHTTKWVITIPGPQGKTKITYDNDKKTRTVQEPGKPPVEQDPAKDPGAKDWKEGLEKAEKEAKENPGTPGQQGSLRFPFFSNWLITVSYPIPESTGAASAPRQNFTISPRYTILAATVEMPGTGAPPTQEKPILNLKLVTYGAPLPEPVIHLDPGPATTPEEFVQKPPPSGWHPPTDSPGPTTVTPGPTGTPITPIPGGWITVGSGWASVTLPGSYLVDCGGDEDEDEGPKSTERVPTDEEELEHKRAIARERELEEAVREALNWDGTYSREGEGDLITRVREDIKSAEDELAQLHRDRPRNCVARFLWETWYRDPITHTQDRLTRQQWQMEIYEEAYRKARSQGNSNRDAHWYADRKLKEWRREGFEMFANLLAEHLQIMGGAITGREAIKALAQHADDLLRFKDIARRREIFNRALEQAKAQKQAGAPPQTQARESTGTERYRPGEGPPRPGSEPGRTQERAECAPPLREQPGDPARNNLVREYNDVVNKIQTRDAELSNKMKRLNKDDLIRQGKHWWEEQPGDRLSTRERAALQRDVDRLMTEEAADINRAIQLNNRINPRPAGPTAPPADRPITRRELDAWLRGANLPPKTAADTDRTTILRDPIGGPPRSGPGQTQRLPEVPHTK